MPDALGREKGNEMGSDYNHVLHAKRSFEDH